MEIELNGDVPFLKLFTTHCLSQQMEAKHTDTEESTEDFYGCLEAYARQHLQAWLQDLLEQEGTEVLGAISTSASGPVASKPGIAMGMGNPGG